MANFIDWGDNYNVVFNRYYKKYPRLSIKHTGQHISEFIAASMHSISNIQKLNKNIYKL